MFAPRRRHNGWSVMDDYKTDCLLSLDLFFLLVVVYPLSFEVLRVWEFQTTLWDFKRRKSDND